MKIRKSHLPFILLCFFTTWFAGFNFVSGQDRDAVKIKPAEAKSLLSEGNIRFVSGNTLHPRQDADRRKELANGQHPYAVILGCSDSRISPEIVFDQGLGDLFVSREAGNVFDAHTIGSIEYAVEHIHVSLVVVLGHEKCGAIAAARDTAAAAGHIKSIMDAIGPAVKATKGQDAEATCMANIRNIVVTLRTSEPLLKHLVESGELLILGAYYELNTGIVTFLDVN